MRTLRHVVRALYVWGNAEHGRLGLGRSTGGETTPIQCKAVDHIKAVQCGGAHTLTLTSLHLLTILKTVVKDTGEVWSFGLNSRGQLGHSPDSEHVILPKEVEIPEPIQSISAGNWHTLCLAESGNLWSFGCNAFGQLGLGPKAGNAVFQPQQVENFTGIEICCGASHSLAINHNGELFSWGTNQHGQLGHEKGFFSSSVEYTPRLIRILRETNITSLGAGHVSSGAIDENGNIYTWGGNQFWQLGHSSASGEFIIPQLVPDLRNAKKLMMGGFHTMCITQNLSVYIWGSNENGCLGIGRQSPDGLSVNFMGAASDPTGEIDYTNERSPRSIRDFRSIPMIVQNPLMLPELRLLDGSLGWKHSCGVGLRGEIYSWGWGGAVGESSPLLEGDQGPGGQLGVGDDFDSWSPLPVKMDTDPSKQAINFRFVDCGLNHTAAIGEPFQD